MVNKTKKTLIMGASTNPSRYAYMAAERLLSKGVDIELLGRKGGEVLQHSIKTDSTEISQDIHTVTMYLSEANQKDYEDFILNLEPVESFLIPVLKTLILKNAWKKKE